MPLKTYSEQFKRDAALYESTEGPSLKSVATELGINRNTLKAWIARFSSNPRAGSADQSEAAAITDAERIRTSSTPLDVCACQATIRWEYTSTMSATYTHPALVIT
ncbi:transposase [Corynebacterium variabile]|uniref:transposase n=1 Tax=Corynebacterium variabile TaxID=1727 RepID=UPI003A8DCF69